MFVLALPVNDGLSGGAVSGNHWHREWHVGENKARSEKLGRSRLAGGQVGRKSNGRSSGWCNGDRRYGLIEHIFGGLFIGNIGHGYF